MCCGSCRPQATRGEEERSQSLHLAAQRTFTINSLRPEQLELLSLILRSIEAKRLAPGALLVVSATGSGKSLLFQLPPLCIVRRRTVVVVVSPLVALVGDQVRALHAKHVGRAVVLNEESVAELTKSEGVIYGMSQDCPIGYFSVTSCNLSSFQCTRRLRRFCSTALLSLQL